MRASISLHFSRVVTSEKAQLLFESKKSTLPQQSASSLSQKNQPFRNKAHSQRTFGSNLLISPQMHQRYFKTIGLHVPVSLRSCGRLHHVQYGQEQAEVLLKWQAQLVSART
jgi:hypothetical protein